ncbi:MAG TPA: NirA family protein [Opitutaceae bacterium]|nr:NirA family protein [Opitutaceae bacterium]
MSTAAPTETPSTGFTPEQKQYLEGFLAALAAQPALSRADAPAFVGVMAGGQLTATPADAPANLAAPAPLSSEPNVFGTPLGELCKPEKWKYDENPLDIWEKLVAHADADKFPDEADTFRFKFHGLFYVAPAQNAFMVRLRIPAGELTATQLHGIADLAADWGGGYAHITTRANIQIRECRPRDIVKILVRLQELGLTSRGSGADNIRNITASPNSGFDPDELIDVRPYAKGLHHYILNHRDLYGLPRKFNIAFDNGGSLSAAADTNDIGFMAVRVTEKSLSSAAAAAGGTAPSPRIEPGIYFRVQLGGITGHKDFARDTGLLVRPNEVVAVAAAMVRVFNEHGCRTDRKKARLKYLLEKWGAEKFVAETQQKLAFLLLRLPLEACEPRRPFLKHGWLGVYKQSQRGLNSIGIGIPVGRLTPKQMHALADVATNYGKGELRLTVWENLIIPHVADAFVETARRGIQRLGFTTEAHNLTSGIVSCTGSKGCKYSSTDTKAHAVALGKRLAKIECSSPVNFHFTGCPHSCAQHYCGDLGFLGAKLVDGTEGYHIVIGGGMGDEQGIAREIFKGVRAEELPALVEKILAAFEAKKKTGESFVAWTRRHSVNELQVMFS